MPGPIVNIRSTVTGERHSVTADEAQQIIAAEPASWRIESEAESAATANAQVVQDAYSDPLDKFGALAGEGLSVATLGATDAAMGAVMSPEQREAVRNVRSANPEYTAAGGLAGAAIPLLAGDAAPILAKLPVSAASRLGAALARTGEGAGLATRAGRAALGAGVEGGLYGVGTAASDLALDDEPATLDRIAGELSSRFVTTGGVSALAGGGLSLLESGIAATGRRFKAARQAEEAAATAPIADDLAQLDKKQLVAARQAEEDALEAARVPERAQIADELAAFREQMKVERPWDAVATGSKAKQEAAAKEAKKALTEAKKAAKRAELAAAESTSSTRLVDAEGRAPQTWKEFTAERMGAAMKSEGGHGPAMKKLGADWRAYRATLRKEAVEAPPELAARAQQLADEATAARAAADEAAAAYTAVREAQLAAHPRWMREAGITSLKPDRALDNLLNDPKALSGAAGVGNFESAARSAQRALRVQETAFERIMQHADDLKVIHALDTSGTRAAALARIPAALEKNRAFQQRLEALVAKPAVASPRIKELTHAIDAWEAPKMTTRQKLGGALAFGATMGAVGAVGSVTGVDIPGLATIAPVLGAAAGSAVATRLGSTVSRSVAASKGRSAKAIETLLGRAERGVRGVRKAAPVLSSRVLASTRFAEDEPRRGETPKPESSLTIAQTFERRSGELRSLVAPTPDGTLAIRPHVRMQIAERLQPIAATAPHLADRLETRIVRRLEFLANKLPKTVQIGMTRIPPSEMQIRTWARYLAAADDPSGIEERVAEGTIRPEDAEVMRELYRDRMDEFIAQVTENLGTLRTTLPRQSRLALSIFTGIAVDAAMEPRILARLQGVHATEPGSEGGTQAPKPRPAFGSVKKPEPTPAQQRAG